MTELDASYDVVVVGAGVAGCLFARDMARAGHDVLILEARPRGELGHNWWDSIKKAVFDKVGVDHPRADELYRAGTMYITSPQESTKYRIPPTTTSYVIDRRKFAQRLVANAIAAGATLHDETVVTGPLIAEGDERVAGVTLEGGRAIRARVIADCSGYHGVLRAQLPFETDFVKRTAPKDTFVTYREIHPKREGVEKDHGIWFFGRHKGLAWVSFEQPDLVDFFAGHIDIPSVTISPKRMVRQLYERYRDECEDEIVRGGYGHQIPLRRALDSFVADGLVVIGDAACQCHPVNGCGMASSMYGAHFAAKAAHRALIADAVDTPTLWQYNVDYHRSAVNRTFAAFDVIQKYLLTLTEDEVEFMFKKKLVDFAKVGHGEPTDLSPGPLGAITLIFKSLGRLDILMVLKNAAQNARTVRRLIDEYPERSSTAELARWRALIERCYPPEPR